MSRTLVVITGPVGGGKSTVALALAERLRTAGQATAVIDLDVLYLMARQRAGYDEANIWGVARHGAAALADAFFAEGMTTVIVEGEFFTSQELAALRVALTTPAAFRFVTLEASLATVLGRVAGDPSRGASRDPVFLARLHAQFVAARPFLREASQLLDANEHNPLELAGMICGT